VQLFDKESKNISALVSSKPVSAVAISPSKRYIAIATMSMQASNKAPVVTIQDICDKEPLPALPAFHLTKIKSMCFSKDSRYLAIIAGAGNLTVVFHSPSGRWWGDVFILTSFPTTSLQICFASYSQSSKELFVFGGEGFLLLCGTSGGHQLSYRKGAFRPQSDPQTLLCGVPTERQFVTGCASGDILLWTDGAVSRTVVGHEEPIIAISHLPNIDCTITASLDSNIKIWSPVFGLEKNISMESSLGTFGVADWNILTCQLCDDKKALVKITNGEVFELSLISGRCTKLFTGIQKK